MLQVVSLIVAVAQDAGARGMGLLLYLVGCFAQVDKMRRDAGSCPLSNSRHEHALMTQALSVPAYLLLAVALSLIGMPVGLF